MALRIDESLEFSTRLIKPGPMLPCTNTSKTDDGGHTYNVFGLTFNYLMGLLPSAIRRPPKA